MVNSELSQSIRRFNHKTFMPESKQKQKDNKYSALDLYIASTEKLNKALANFRTDQYGFKKEMKREILEDIRRSASEAEKLDYPPKTQ